MLSVKGYCSTAFSLWQFVMTLFLDALLKLMCSVINIFSPLFCLNRLCSDNKQNLFVGDVCELNTTKRKKDFYNNNAKSQCEFQQHTNTFGLCEEFVVWKVKQMFWITEVIMAVKAQPPSDNFVCIILIYWTKKLLLCLIIYHLRLSLCIWHVFTKF